MKYILLFILYSFIFPEHRKSCGDGLELDSSATIEGDKENKMSWKQRSKSLEVLVDEKQNNALSQQNGHITKEVSKFNRPAMVVMVQIARRKFAPGYPQQLFTLRRAKYRLRRSPAQVTPAI